MFVFKHSAAERERVAEQERRAQVAGQLAVAFGFVLLLRVTCVLGRGGGRGWRGVRGARTQGGGARRV